MKVVQDRSKWKRIEWDFFSVTGKLLGTFNDGVKLNHLKR